MNIASPFTHLTARCNELLEKYLNPIIAAENDALLRGDPIPAPDFDSIAAFRLLAHAELEGYFEQRANQHLDVLDASFKQGKIYVCNFSAFIFFCLFRQKRECSWQVISQTDDAAIKAAELSDIKRLAQESLGFARRFVKENNGIKENSINVLTAFMGRHPDEIDNVLVAELNQYGKLRGDVAHDSWHRNTRTFSSAQIEKDRIAQIVKLISSEYEPALASAAIVSAPHGWGRTGLWSRVATFFAKPFRKKS